MNKKSTKEMKKGSLVISLDFELMWGMIDNPQAEQYKETNVRQVPEVIDRLLDTFQKHKVHATFATVGFISYPNPEALLKELPDSLPQYKNTSLNPYFNDYIKRIPEEDYPIYFRPDLIEKIKQTPGMEIGTHTFSHYYCWEEGQTLENFDADIAKAKEIGIKIGAVPQSIIFPRNNVSKEHLEVCRRHGVTIFRGNPSKFFKNKKSRLSSIFQSACRLADNYVNLSGRLSFPQEEIYEGEMVNVRASRMLRPYMPSLKKLEPLRLRRIKKEMTRAAKRGEIYHLWWHPHNFGANMEENFSFLENLLNHYDHLHSTYGMTSSSMSETARKS